MKKIVFISIVFLFVLVNNADAGWVNGYYRSDGNYVDGYYRTESNYYKWDNNSWDGDWSDSYNDKSWYRDYGYDPEPFDYETPNYNYWDSYNSYEYDGYYNDYDWNY